MKSTMLRLALGMTLAGSLHAAAFAEGEVKALPTLLIKGEVVSLDANDPAATLLKVKDRYGFETPIYLTTETKIAQGDTTLNASNLAAGTQVEVEYNFDVNTAKRHAVSVKVAVPTPPQAAAVPAAAPAEAMPTPPPAAEPAAAPAATPAEPAEAAPAPEPAAPETQ